MNNILKSPKLQAWIYLLLIWILSLPFWLMSYIVKGSNLPDNLPLTDIGASLTPTFSALIIIAYSKNWKESLLLFQRIFDFNRIKDKNVLYFSIFLFPVLYILTYFFQMLVGFKTATPHLPSIKILPIFLMFFVASIAEELGYGAYATEEFQKHYSPLKTAFIIGVPWALWHLNSMIQIGQTTPLILWGLCGTIAVRVVYVWLYNISNHSVFSLILCHTVANTARTFYPGSRPAYEMRNGSIGYGIIIIFALFVVFKTKEKLK
ncbi:CAAX amino terminal protease self- immunity [Streptococcus parauberis]|uniref:CPBP family intramembrane glutamic endopeptidase n=1 Tax=Streptococcus parauberis TaxID=1348 RepID=UPI000CCF5EEF|nr:type II CAAX endopeptidase family protein [Streptococcus parauberis]PNY20876.1 CAAX amino terminal protease self- immunity [Streptococcus parauberis]